MELLQRQLLSPKYIQHSARVLFVVAEAGDDRAQADTGSHLRSLSRGNSEAGRDGHDASGFLAAHDYVYDIFAPIRNSFAATARPGITPVAGSPVRAQIDLMR